MIDSRCLTDEPGTHVASVYQSLQHLSETDTDRLDWTRFNKLSSSLRENEFLVMTRRLQTILGYCKSLCICVKARMCSSTRVFGSSRKECRTKPRNKYLKYKMEKGTLNQLVRIFTVVVLQLLTLHGL
jgi:hypothetical protein